MNQLEQNLLNEAVKYLDEYLYPANNDPNEDSAYKFIYNYLTQCDPIKLHGWIDDGLNDNGRLRIVLQDNIYRWGNYDEKAADDYDKTDEIWNSLKQPQNYSDEMSCKFADYAEAVFNKGGANKLGIDIKRKMEVALRGYGYCDPIRMGGSDHMLSLDCYIDAHKLCANKEVAIQVLNDFSRASKLCTAMMNEWVREQFMKFKTSPENIENTYNDLDTFMRDMKPANESKEIDLPILEDKDESIAEHFKKYMKRAKAKEKASKKSCCCG